METINIQLPAGPLGVTIKQSDGSGGIPANQCIVTSKKNSSSPLEVHDVIISLNGIQLSTVEVGDEEGGIAAAWGKLFVAFGGAVRNLVVQRYPSSSLAAAAVGSGAKQPAPKKVTPKPSAAAAAARPSAGAGGNNSAATGNAKGKGNATKKHALHDSTKHNATSQEPKADAKKKPAPRKKKSTKANNTNNAKKGGKDDFTHDDAYIDMVDEGLPKQGSVDPTQSYYITKTSECYVKIADKVGLDDPKELNKVEFNSRFYGTLKLNQQFQRGTIVKIPTELVCVMRYDVCCVDNVVMYSSDAPSMLFLPLFGIQLQCSKWKLNKLVDNHVEEVKELGTCTKCMKKGMFVCTICHFVDFLHGT